MNKRQKKKFEKKGRIKKFIFDDEIRVAQYNSVICLIIKHGKIRKCTVLENDILHKNYHLTKDKKRRVILIARCMHRIKVKCVDFTPAFRITPETVFAFPPKPIRYYKFKFPSYMDYLNKEV